MSREHKFRARWEDTGKVIEDFMNDESIEALNADDVIVEEWSGLKDSKGIDIYEGDIIRYYADGIPEKEQRGALTNGPFGSYPIHIEVLPWKAKFSDHEHGDYHEMIDQIVFQDGAFWCENGGGLGSIALVAPNCEVIGNRHDNPELMETAA